MPRPRWLVAGLLLAAVATVVVVIAVRGSAPASRPSTVPRAPARPPGPPAAPASSGEQFGASVNRLFQSPIFSPAAIAAQLTALRAAGATIARSDALWDLSEPAAPVGGHHRYDWTFDDRVAGDLAARGLRWLPIIDYSAGWARLVAGQLHSPPRSDADYAAYAAAFAARYGPGGGFWSAHPSLPAVPVEALEVWNEPDNPTFWSPAPDPAGYAQLYRQTRAAVAAVAPRVRVLVGGLWHLPHFLPALVRAAPDLVGRVDGIATHPYARSPAAITAAVGQDRRVLDRLGLASVPLWVTEFGWTTSPPGARDYLPAAQRPAALAGTLADLGRAGCGMAAVIAYTWVTEQQDPGVSSQWFGIANANGTPSADVAAYAFGVREARASGRARGACPGG